MTEPEIQMTIYDLPALAEKPPKVKAYARNNEDRENRIAMQHQILRALRHSPATCEQLCDRLDAKHQSVSPALLSLRKEQLIRWEGKSRTKSGKLANICHITGRGLALLQGAA